MSANPFNPDDCHRAFRDGVAPLFAKVTDETKLAAFEQKLGVRISRQDVLFQPLPLPDASVDIVTCFNSLEHWHHSPKRLFREIVRVLKPRGMVTALAGLADHLLRPFPTLCSDIFVIGRKTK